MQDYDVIQMLRAKYSTPCTISLMNALGVCGQQLKPTLLGMEALERSQKLLGWPKRPSDEVGVSWRPTNRLRPQKRNGASGIQAEDASS